MACLEWVLNFRQGRLELAGSSRKPVSPLASGWRTAGRRVHEGVRLPADALP